MPRAVGLSGSCRPSMSYHVSCFSADVVVIPVSESFMKSNEIVPSAAIWMLVMALPMKLRPSAAVVNSVAAGDDSSVRLSLTASVSESVYG